ncbi:hypothetical protein MLD38_018359 [Melastoma candidum]|uniref:Uncharacterized protein n=1 Tax=Melastoma candidum TaxID=119954 RepID=A0ACB9QTM0_9MYRT|nr:hypothetical protein MLD38_018359 [Melastoma candidum]
MHLENNASINTTSMGGPPPPQTSGTPVGYDGAGGGHGGRGASCVKTEKSNWGGDVYSWSPLSEPWSYGSKGSGTSSEKKFGGNGGGRVKLMVKDVLFLDGYVLAEGGDGGSNAGGGSGGSIIIQALKLKGRGLISAAGGRGLAGGGGGRISLNCYSITEDIKVTVCGGSSLGCPRNAGAAGTFFNADLMSLRVDNDHAITETETPLLDFSTSHLWSHMIIENGARVLVPLVWTRVQVRGQISLYNRSFISFGLSEFPVSEFELVAEEILMSDSIVKVYGALRVAVKMLLMLNSQIYIDGGGKNVVTTSVLEVRNLVVLTQNSVIRSNTNLAIYGQGLLRLTGQGDAIIGQRLSLSLFYNITVGPGALLQAPLDDLLSRSKVTEPLCGRQTCPVDLITPPDDCHVNYTLSFSLQICRVEDLLVNGLIKGSIIHIHRARTVTVDADGMISASELGCSGGIGRGNYIGGAGSGAGHGGAGGCGYFNGTQSRGGLIYGNADLPCELGSGTQGANLSYGNVFGGGMIVMGSTQWPLLSLIVQGFLRADGQSSDALLRRGNNSLIGGLGGGSGGTILLFLQQLTLEEQSVLSVQGGKGGFLGGGGGGGGRVHFHWSNIDIGNEYVPVATINGSISSSGGLGATGGYAGEEGTVSGKECPVGLYGTYCEECPVGTYKNVDGSDARLCTPCSQEKLPRRSHFIYVRGGVSQPPCPYECISEKYKMPKCVTPLEELLDVFGSSYCKELSTERTTHLHFPYLLSLTEVHGTRAEETQSHVHRLYFMGPNTFREPWHLPYSPPDAIIDIVYEDAFSRFIEDINSVAAYDWWEGSVHTILSVLAYPCAWSWKQWRRKQKIHRLQEYVKSDYDHSCLRSCRSRALYKGMKVGATPDLVVAHIDFFLGGDEKRVDMASIIEKRFPMCILFGGDGSYMSPYRLHNDILLTNVLGQHVPSSVWNRLVDGLNAHLRTVRQGSIRTSLRPVLTWINSHVKPQLEFHGVRMELGWFQASASGYYQLGVLVAIIDQNIHEWGPSDSLEENGDCLRKNSATPAKSPNQVLQSTHTNSSHAIVRKRIAGGVSGGLLTEVSLKSLDFKRDFAFPMCLLLRNMRPIGWQDALQHCITIMLLADLSVTILTLLQLYWISIGALLAVLLILPLSMLSPFPAGISALFSREPRRASLSRIFALWNSTSLFNIIVAFVCGVIHYVSFSFHLANKAKTWSIKIDDYEWWLLPTILILFKSLQARLVDWHIANLEVQDFTLYCSDPEIFWAHESS